MLVLLFRTPHISRHLLPSALPFPLTDSVYVFAWQRISTMMLCLLFFAFLINLFDIVYNCCKWGRARWVRSALFVFSFGRTSSKSKNKSSWPNSACCISGWAGRMKTVVNPGDLTCNSMKSVFQIKFYLILDINNVAGLLHMNSNANNNLWLQQKQNISPNSIFFFFFKFHFQSCGLQENTRIKVVLHLSEEVSRGALPGNCVRDCVGRSLFQTNIFVFKDRFFKYEL